MQLRGIRLTPQAIHKFGTYVVRATEDARAFLLRKVRMGRLIHPGLHVAGAEVIG